jgi:hypothetical protein
MIIEKLDFWTLNFEKFTWPWPSHCFLGIEGSGASASLFKLPEHQAGSGGTWKDSYECQSMSQTEQSGEINGRGDGTGLPDS